MDRRRINSLLLASLLCAGCASGGNTELLERELRLQEDRIYELEDLLEEKCKQLQKCAEQENGQKPADQHESKSPFVEEPQEPATERSQTQPARRPNSLQEKPAVEIPGLPPPPQASNGPELTRPNRSVVKPPPTGASASGTSAAPAATPISTSAAPALLPQTTPADARRADGSTLANPGGGEGWDSHPKSNLKLFPKVSSYRTNASPLNPPPGQVHVRLATVEPDSSTSLVSRPAATLIPSPPRQNITQQLVLTPHPKPDEAESSHVPEVSQQVALQPEASQPEVSQPDVPQSVKTWSAAAPSPVREQERVARGPARNDAGTSSDASVTSDANGIPLPPPGARRRPAWTPYR